MKVWFWVSAGLSVAAGLLISFTSLLWRGLGLIGTAFGEVLYYAAVAAVGVGIIGVILGVFSLRRNGGKRAIVLALLGVIYSGVVIAGMAVDDMMKPVVRNRDFERHMEELYGEGWDKAPAIEGIPERYQNVLNQFYVTVRDRWPAEKLVELGAVSMPDYYGDASLDNIGFALMDLNGDAIDELVIGTVGSAEGEATLVFCVYANPLSPYYDINSLEGEVYYLHPGEADGLYKAEIAGRDSAWVIEPAATGGIFGCTEQAEILDPVGRLTLEMIPFSQYK